VQDDLDILVDLCGYAGTSLVAEIMASRYKLQQDMGDKATNTQYPIHVSYMGFPGSMGSYHWDYSIFDKHVVPPSLRDYYSGALVYMPHCYFVNSHRTVISGPGDGIMLANAEEKAALRAKYGLDASAFVYCCHSRPDKIDPSTFRSWMRALIKARDECKKNGVKDEALPVMWLLRSGDEMEKNLRSFVRREFDEGIEHALIFADVAERNEHLRRLGCADVFLDTPAYGAHTLGVDALYLGVPMISLRLESKSPDTKYSDIYIDDHVETEKRSIPTDKLASMVGSSLLRAVSCEDLIVDNMQAYENVMAKCAINGDWFGAIRNRLTSSRSESPLFDTNRWCANLETAFLKMKEVDLDDLPDIVVIDK
jgi:predicted O-linked N-acetylglucosamine transferase (SPINDLY family)